MHTNTNCKGGELPEDAQRRICEQFYQLMEIFYKRHMGISFYTERIGCSESTLNRALKGQKGMTPLQIINNRLLFEAKQMLTVNTAMSIKEISFALGFKSQAYFTAFFTKSTEMSPKNFRDTYK